MGSSIDETKIHVELTPPPNTNKQDYAGGTNDGTRDSQKREYGDSPSDTDGCARNLDEEHKMKKVTITLTLHLKNIYQNYKKKSGIGYYPKKFIQSNQSGYV